MIVTYPWLRVVDDVEGVGVVQLKEIAKEQEGKKPDQSFPHPGVKAI